MNEQRRIIISETAKKVAQVLAENRVTYSEVLRVFREAEMYLTVQTEQDSIQGDTEYVLVREPYQTHYSLVKVGSGRESSLDAR